MSELSEAINEMRTMRESYDVLATELADSKQTIADAINQMGGSATADMTWAQLASQIGRLNAFAGIVLDESVSLPLDVVGLIYSYSTQNSPIKKIINSTVLSHPGIYNSIFLEYANFPLATSGGGFDGCSKLSEFRAEMLNTLSTDKFRNCYNIKKIFIPNISSFSGNVHFANCTNLIDLTIGRNFQSNYNFTIYTYNPTQAYRTDISSLCFDTDLEEYGRVFANNFAKWKWCIINHFAANMQDRTGMNAYTITFGTTVLSHFDAEMIAAFTDKNWTLA